MSDSIFQQPSPQQLAAFIQGDPVAEDEVLRLVLPQLYRWSAQNYPNLPQSEVQSIIHQVVSETCRPHVRYDPSKAKLTTYLIGLIKLRLNDLYQKENKIISFEESGSNPHEKLPQVLYNQSETIDKSTRITRAMFFQEVENSLNDLEKDFLKLMRQGEKRLYIFVEILKQYCPVSDPEREVKNTKERLKRKLKATAQDLNYRLEDLLDE